MCTFYPEAPCCPDITLTSSGFFSVFFPPAVAVPQSPAEISLAAQGGKGSTSSLNSSTSSDKGDKDGRGKVGRWVLFPCIAAFFLC